MVGESRASVSYRDLVTGLRTLGLGQDRPIIAHASLSAFGEVHGGAETLLGAMLSSFGGIIMPAFTSRPDIIPEVGPNYNACAYGSGKSTNLMAEFFQPIMPADKIIGTLSETLRKHEGACRSTHPLLSFTGLRIESILHTQTLRDPLAPIGALATQDGWVLLMGVDHTTNTSIHYAEKLAGRKQFIRWALTSEGICECPGIPGCSDGFNAIAPLLASSTRRVTIGDAQVQAIPLKALISMVTTVLAANPLGLLCKRPDCQRCNTIRQVVAVGL